MDQRTRIKALAASALLALMTFGSPTVWAQTTTLKWAHVYEVSESYHKQALWAADEIKKRSNGKYTIEVFPASTLGTVDIIYTGMAFAGRTYPPMSIATAPFVFRDFAHWQAFRNGPVFKELADAYGAKSGGNHTWAAPTTGCAT